jgi:uncharacterized Zn finger protein
MGDVKCLQCGWEGSIDELESEVVKMGLEKVSNCPDCGSSSKMDLIEINGMVP